MWTNHGKLGQKFFWPRAAGLGKRNHGEGPGERERVSPYLCDVYGTLSPGVSLWWWQFFFYASLFSIDKPPNTSSPFSRDNVKCSTLNLYSYGTVFACSLPFSTVYIDIDFTHCVWMCETADGSNCNFYSISLRVLYIYIYLFIYFTIRRGWISTYIAAGRKVSGT